MKVAVLGAGNGGCAVAAELSLKGHNVTLVKTSSSINNENFKYILDNDGKIEMHENGKITEAKISTVTTDIASISQAEIIIVYIQTKYHEQLIQKMIPHLTDGQIVIFNPGYLSTAYMLKYNALDTVIVVEAESSFIDCRISKPGTVNVCYRNVCNPLGIYPTTRKQEAILKLEQLGFSFSYLSSVAEAALHNPNMIVHTVGAVMSIPRIENVGKDYSMYHEVFTPSVWKILERLDIEKMNVLEKLGFERLPYVEACKIRNSADDTRDAKDIFFEYAYSPTVPAGPFSVDSRYITEDVSQGLVMLEALGEHLGASTPVASSLIELASAALGRDMRADGRSLLSLGKDNISKILIDCGHTAL